MKKYVIYPDATVPSQSVVFNTEEQCWIPMSEGNRHYQEYLAWVAEGNTAEEWNPWESAPSDEA